MISGMFLFRGGGFREIGMGAYIGDDNNDAVAWPWAFPIKLAPVSSTMRYEVAAATMSIGNAQI